MPAAVEGFLDVAHFAWIHTDTFADPDNQQVPDYTQETPFGFVADYWSSVGNYPASSDFARRKGSSGCVTLKCICRSPLR